MNKDDESFIEWQNKVIKFNKDNKSYIDKEKKEVFQLDKEDEL